MASLTSIPTTTRVSSSQSSFLYSNLLPVSSGGRGISPNSISFTSFRIDGKNNRSLKSCGLERVFKVKAATEEKYQQIQLDNSGGDGLGGGAGRGGGGGGGDNNGNSNNNEEEEFEGDLNKKRKMAMSMSQKLTLGYAALVGVGGLMGYLKSGSQKSLAAGGLSALLLYYVYTQLPTNPVFASSLGFGLSAALLGVMGSRFKKSGKVFPAGVVSFVSLVMTGGYLHGIMRSGLHG